MRAPHTSGPWARSQIITSEDDKCLPGTVRRILLDVCKENDIPVFKKTLSMATYRCVAA